MAQKAVLDNKALENINLNEYLPKTGGTINGNLTITGNLVANIDNSNSLKGFASTTVPTADANCKIIYNYNIYNNATGCFPTHDNSNGILTIGRHGGNYNTQLGFSSNGNLYHRSFSNQVIDTSTSWKTILDNNNYNSLIHPANSYGVYRFANGTTINSSNSPTASITITTHGRPVFIGVSGDFNCYGGAAWGFCVFYKDGSEIKRQIGEGNSNSQNIPFGWFYLDTPTAGSHTYKVTFTIGSGQIQFTENGANEAPQFIVFEI